MAVTLLTAAAGAGVTIRDTSPESHDLDAADRILRDQVRPFLDAHCVSCHGGAKPKADLDLTRARSGEQALLEIRDYRRVLEMLRLERMPPKGRPPLDGADRMAAILAVERLVNFTIPEERAPVGRVTIRRLNRYEYDRTVFEFLGVKYDSSKTFPSDPGGHGFDNIGDVMSASPLVAEKYFDATRDVLDRLFENRPLVDVLLTQGPGPSALTRYCLTRGFRRPPAPDELDARLRLWRDVASTSKGNADASLRAILASIILSPYFLFRVEGRSLDTPPAPDGSIELDGYELATRLSYFLWSSPPDEPLLTSARQGYLREPVNLHAQTTRMLADPKARALSESFGGQWLRFREILDRAVDFRRYPKFNDGLRQAMYAESASVFESIVRDDRSVLELLDADWTIVNGTLARHYGIVGVDGDSMRTVKLPDRRRGGVLGWGSTLTVTSYPLRTSPVLRGKYVLESLLGDPPPPPPGVPDLPKDDVQADKLTPRARLERHRSDAACASCHVKIDPPGFALENFDGIGEWREKFQEVPIDSIAVMPDGTTLDGAAALKDYLLSRHAAFARVLAEKLFVYGVGRPAEGGDEALLRRIVREAASNEYRFSAFVHGIVNSRAFRFRQVPTPR